MRISNRRWRATGLIVVAGLAVACASAPPASPTVAPTDRPTPTAGPTRFPDAGATADDLYRAVTAYGLAIVANNADTPSDPDRVKRINATYAGWPLSITEFTTPETLAGATRWKDGGKPGHGEPPVAVAGLNVLVEWGPTTGTRPPAPEGARLPALDRMVDALDLFLGPLRVRASIDVPVPTLTPPPTPGPTSAPT